MREPRNPFRLRASEHIESDTTFVRLFGPGMLELLKKDGVLDCPRIIRSAPGGGKTSLMRLFTPGPLLTLYSYQLLDDCKELFRRMVEIGAVTDNGPTLLGTMISCDRNYAVLADAGLDTNRQTRVLFALLNARLVLTTLRSALELKKLDYPTDLDRIELLHPGNGDAPAGLALPCRGTALNNWAQSLEDSICDALDSFGGFTDAPLAGSDTLTALSFLRPKTLLCDGAPVAERLLFMFDNVHTLTKQQRQSLLDTALALRTNNGIWLAERLENLSCGDLLSPGAILGRDYEVTFIESSWRGLQKRFEQLSLNIAQRRAEQAVGIETQSFAACLETSLEGTEWQEKHQMALQVIRARILKKTSGSNRYVDWIAEREKLQGTPRQLAVAWRALEILIEREERRNQETFNFALAVENLKMKDDSSLKTAAELFLASEFKLPFYFGPATLAKLASSNIEQFLWLAGDEFEEIVSANLINPKEVASLNPDRQEAILKQASASLWDQIPRRVPAGRAVHCLLKAIAEFSNWYTYRPSAPNDPGVNAVAITMRDRDKIMDASYVARYPEHGKLAEVLASALANNLLEADLDYVCKGDSWMVLNLNRLLCVRHRLPLNYGKFKEKTLAELCEWMKDGFNQPEKEPELL